MVNASLPRARDGGGAASSARARRIMRADHEDTARGSREAQGLERYLDLGPQGVLHSQERSGARCRRGDLGTPLTPYETSCASLIWHHLGVSRRDLASLYAGVLLG